MTDRDAYDESGGWADAALRAAPWIRGRYVFDRLESTQDWAKERLAREVDDLPFAAVAVTQTAGRGRGENRWTAGPGALTFTIGLEPERFGVSTDRCATLSIATALAACEALQRWSPNVPLEIKWPNDLYADGRKLGGILLEGRSRSSDRGSVVLVGVGINVNNRVPAEATGDRPAGISLAEIAGEPIALAEAFGEFLNRLHDEFLAVGRQDPRQAERWNARNLLFGRRCSIRASGSEEPLSGIAGEIAADGALRLETQSGLVAVRSGTVTEWR